MPPVTVVRHWKKFVLLTIAAQFVGLHKVFEMKAVIDQRQRSSMKLPGLFEGTPGSVFYVLILSMT